MLNMRRVHVYFVQLEKGDIAVFFCLIFDYFYSFNLVLKGKLLEAKGGIIQTQKVL